MTQPAHTHSVLVVDDDVDVRESLAEVLADRGYQVVTARNGREALDRLADGVREGRLPCVILLDLNMPVMNGSAFRAHQKADPLLSRIGVVAISSDWDAQVDFETLLRKPIQLPKLEAALRRHC